MNLFVSFDGDSIGRVIGRAVLADDPEEVARTSQKIQSGEDLWRNFAVNHGGKMVSWGGDEGSFEVEADHLDEVQKIAEQYAELVGATVSVGVGTKLSESARALLIAKLRGGNQVILWQDSMAKELAEVKEKGEGEKIAEEYLNKANTPANEGAHAGFEGHEMPKGGSVDKPVATQGDHNEEQGIYNTIAQAQENQIPVETTHAAQDFEDSLHQAAQEQSKKDEQTAQDAVNDHEDLRKQVVAILQKVKQQIPNLAQIKQASPETYQAVMFLVQSVVALGRELLGNDQQPMQKTEAGDTAGTKSVNEQQWERELELAKAEPPIAQDKLPGGRADGKLPRDFDQVELSLGIEHEMEHTNDPLIAREIAMDHLSENPKYYSQLAGTGIEKDEIKETLEKGNGPIAGAPAHHHLNLPVGSQVDGKIKVAHGEGGTSWKGVRAGQITAQDPDAPLFGANSHPTSSREPGAK